MHSATLLAAVVLTIFIATATARPLFDSSIRTGTKRSRRIPNHLLRHGALLPHVVRQSFPTPEKCTSQSDCTPKQECTLDPTTDCKSGFCTGCTTTADCFSGLVCFEQQFGNFCVDEDSVCETSSDCEDDQLCSKQSADPLGLCVQKGSFCESDADCTKPETCTLPTAGDGLGMCQHTCNDDSECGEGQICLTPICMTPECTSDADCDEDESCSFGSCLSTTPPVTDAPTTSAPDTGAAVTVAPVATPSCRSDDDCEPGFVCDSLVEGAERSCIVRICDSPTKPPSASTPSEEEPPPAAEPTPPATTAAATTPASTTTEPSSTATTSKPPDAEATPKPTSTSTPEPTAQPPPASSQPSSTDPTPEPTAPPDDDDDDPAAPSAVCIAASALSAFQPHELLFDTPALAWVLCDAQHSCATPGHMVLYRGDAMMMATYCALVRCEQRRMRVNSPRYTRALRVRSQTRGLEFTAFAARYESGVEERVLRAVVRLGL